jgi:hypothetical protein
MKLLISVAFFGITSMLLMLWAFISLLNVYDHYVQSGELPYLVSHWARGFWETPREFGMDASWFSAFGPFVMFYALLATWAASVRH